MRVRACLAGFMLVAAACSAAPPSPQALTADMLTRFRAAHPGATIITKPGQPLLLLVKPGAGLTEGVIDLNRLYGYCENADPAGCEAARVNLVERLLKPTPKLRREDLRLIVRGRICRVSQAQHQRDAGDLCDRAAGRGSVRDPRG